MRYGVQTAPDGAKLQFLDEFLHKLRMLPETLATPGTSIKQTDMFAGQCKSAGELNLQMAMVSDVPIMDLEKKKVRITRP